LQSQEFVACGLSGQTRLTNLGTDFVPDFQGASRFFEQSLILATDRCNGGELRVHALLPSSMLVHFVRQAGKSLVLGILGLWAALLNIGPSTQKRTISPSCLYFLHTLRMRDLRRCCAKEVFYAPPGTYASSVTAGHRTWPV